MIRSVALHLGASLALAIAAAVPAQARAQSAITPDSAAKRIARGKALFEGKGLCFSCHGMAGVGIPGLGPKLAGTPFLQTNGTLPEVVALIKSGIDSLHSKSGQVMPPKGGSRLSDSEVEMAAEYVMSIRKARPGN